MNQNEPMYSKVWLIFRRLNQKLFIQAKLKFPFEKQEEPSWSTTYLAQKTEMMRVCVEYGDQRLLLRQKHK